MPNPVAIGFNVPFQEAIDFTKKRGVVLPEKYYGELQGIHRALNYSIAGVASLDQLQGVLDSLEESLKNGNTFKQWQKDIRVQDLGLSKARLDNIYRTNIQTAYNRGRWQQQVENQKAQPYLMYDAINDSRVRPSHLAMDGIIRPVGDSFWAQNYPPNGFRCRCRCIALSKSQAELRSKNGTGLNQKITPEMTPDKGWDYHVGEDLTAGIEKAVADRITSERVNRVLKSALKNKLNASYPNMKIITLEQFAPVQKAVSELAVKNPHWFPEGFKGIHAVERADMFAGYYQGAFYFSVADELVSGFKPAIDLASAFSKVNTELTLTFFEEYAVETLWHEITHAMTGVFAERLELGIEPLNEGVVQLSARHNYHKLADTLGIKISHQAEIILNGLAYSSGVSVSPNRIVFNSDLVTP